MILSLILSSFLLSAYSKPMDLLITALKSNRFVFVVTNKNNKNAKSNTQRESMHLGNLGFVVKSSEIRDDYLLYPVHTSDR